MVEIIDNSNLGRFQEIIYNIVTTMVDMKVCIPRNNLEDSPNQN